MDKIMIIGTRRFNLLLLFWLMLFAASSPRLFAQSNWSGTVTCQLDDEEQGVYQRQETQTWTLTGGGPISPNGMPVYNAMWTASGHGALQRTQGPQTVNIQWTVNVPAQPATIAITIRASDGQLMIKPWHSQLRLDNAIAGTRQVIVNGVTQQPVQFSRAAWEWQFPRIEVSPSDNVTGTSQSQADTGGADFGHHFGGMPPNTSCRWQLTKGGSNAQNPVTTTSNGNSGQNQQNSSANPSTQNTPTGMSGGTQNSNSQSSQGNPTVASNQNCETPATVQQSFETMKSTLQTQYNQLIQGASDPNEVTSLQNQEQRMLANLNNQEQHDMAAAAQGCVQASSNQGSNPSVGNTSTGTTSNSGNNSSGNGSNVGSTQTSSNGSNPTGGQNPNGQGNQSVSGSSNSLVSLTTSSGGNGSGNVAITPFGASCGANCMQYNPGTTVTVIAVPNGGSTFSGFNGGACGSTNPCSFTITAPVTVSATFNLSSTGSSSAGNSSTSSTSNTSTSTTGSSSSSSNSNSSGSGSNGSTGSNTGIKLGAPNYQPTLMAMLTGVSPASNNGQSNVTVTLSGMGTHFATGSTKISFARSTTQPQSSSTSAQTNTSVARTSVLAASASIAAPALQPGQVQAPTGTSLTVPVTMNPATAAGTYDITVATPISGGTETVTLKSAFTVTAAPLLTGVNITPPVVTKNIGSSSTTPPAPTSGTYRVTMTGLMCMRAISSDDAVYGAAVIRQYDRRSGQSTMFTNANTWVYGDTNGMINQRKQAGTRGPMGGIGAGNFVPDGFIIGPKDTLPPQSNLFPMLLWQGTLTDGIDALVISPSLWINYGDNSMFFSWNQNEDSLTNSIFLDTHVQNQINSQTFGILSFGASQNVSGSTASTVAGDNTIVAAETIFQAAGLTFGIPVGVFTAGPTHDRPIGVTPASSDPTSTTILPNATLVLTREMIEKHLGSNTWTVVSFDLRDSPASFSMLPGSDRPGEYQMFIQIERQ